MKPGVTIALTGTCHNNRPVPFPTRLWRPACWLGVVAATMLQGCSQWAPSGTPATEVPAWELARAEPSTIHPLARARVALEQQIPRQVVTPLCDEFALVLITDAANWAAVRSRCRLSSAPEHLDFARGAVVGLVASVGERPSERWPVGLGVARVLGGEGWLEFTFEPGLYHPVKTAGYLDLAYVPGLKVVRMVNIGRRSFVLKSTGDDRRSHSW